MHTCMGSHAMLCHNWKPCCILILTLMHMEWGMLTAPVTPVCFAAASTVTSTKSSMWVCDKPMRQAPITAKSTALLASQFDLVRMLLYGDAMWMSLRLLRHVCTLSSRWLCGTIIVKSQPHTQTVIWCVLYAKSTTIPAGHIITLMHMLCMALVSSPWTTNELAMNN